MFGMGFGELTLILAIVVIVFGVGRLGDVGGDLGRAIRNFRKELNDPGAIDVTPKGETKKDESEKK
jgi:sec-independent protein translocase protein TatA